MRKILLLATLPLFFASCEQKTKSLKNEATQDSLGIRTDADKMLFTNKDEVSLELFQDQEAYSYRTREVSYGIHTIALAGKEAQTYVAKWITSTTSCTMCEKAVRSVKAELYTAVAPHSLALSIEHKCDKITFDINTYETVDYGCCAGEDTYQVYDYSSKLIVEYNKVAIGVIPNKPLQFYAGYRQAEYGAAWIGTLYLAYSSADSYAIHIRDERHLVGDCPFSPDVAVVGTKQDQQSGEEFTLWSLEKIDSKEQLNGISIQLNFGECGKNAKVNIPIVNGKPFGKDERVQEVVVK